MENKFILKIVVFVLLLIFSSTIFSQKNKSDLDIYKFRTLSEVINFNKQTTDEMLKKTKLEDESAFIGIDLFHSRVRVQYIGKPRPISESHKEMMATWSRLQNIDSKIVKSYETEILVRECDKEYWIPIQAVVGKDFLKKIKIGEMVTIYAVHLGGKKEKMASEYDWLFLASTFEK